MSIASLSLFDMLDVAKPPCTLGNCLATPTADVSKEEPTCLPSCGSFTAPSIVALTDAADDESTCPPVSRTTSLGDDSDTEDLYEHMCEHAELPESDSLHVNVPEPLSLAEEEDFDSEAQNTLQTMNLLSPLSRLEPIYELLDEDADEADPFAFSYEAQYVMKVYPSGAMPRKKKGKVTRHTDEPLKKRPLLSSHLPEDLDQYEPLDIHIAQDLQEDTFGKFLRSLVYP